MTLYTCFGDFENTTWRSWLGGVENNRLDCDSACRDAGGLGDKGEGSLEDGDDEGLGDDRHFYWSGDEQSLGGNNRNGGETQERIL